MFQFLCINYKSMIITNFNENKKISKDFNINSIINNTKWIKIQNLNENDYQNYKLNQKNDFGRIQTMIVANAMLKLSSIISICV